MGKKKEEGKGVREWEKGLKRGKRLGKGDTGIREGDEWEKRKRKWKG